MWKVEPLANGGSAARHRLTDIWPVPQLSIQANVHLVTRLGQKENKKNNSCNASSKHERTGKTHESFYVLN